MLRSASGFTSLSCKRLPHVPRVAVFFCGRCGLGELRTCFGAPIGGSALSAAMAWKAGSEVLSLRGLCF